MRWRYLGKVVGGEGNGTGMDSEVGGIENDELGIGDDIDVDGDRAGKFARVEVWFETYIVSFWDGEFWELGLSFELLHFGFGVLINVERGKAGMVVTYRWKASKRRCFWF